jgi:glycosyltransferase involved in cell wall biosynthesis
LSLLGQSVKCHEIIVVDGGSDDGTVDIVKTFSRNSLINVILMSDPHGTPASSRNKGLYASSGDIIAFLDSDCEAPPEWLATIKEFFSKNQEKVGGICGPYVPSPQSDNFAWFVYHSFRILMQRFSSQFLGRENRERNVSSMPAGNSAYLRDVLIKVGGFDPRLRWCEDTDLGIRIRKEGYVLKFIPKMYVFHNWVGWKGLLHLSKTAYRYGLGRAISSKVKPSLFPFKYFLLSILSVLFVFLSTYFPLIFIIMFSAYFLLCITIEIKYRILTLTGPFGFPFFVFSYMVGLWVGLVKIVGKL